MSNLSDYEKIESIFDSMDNGFRSSSTAAARESLKRLQAKANESDFWKEEAKRLKEEAEENAAKANVWEQTCTLIEALGEFIKAAEIGRMVEAWRSDPNHQVIFKTLLINGGEILHPLDSALEKFRLEQDGELLE